MIDQVMVDTGQKIHYGCSIVDEDNRTVIAELMLLLNHAIMKDSTFSKVGNMPYVSRDADGLVSAILLKSQPDATEFLPNDHPDILQFFGGAAPEHLDSEVLGALYLSDAGFVRVIEDVIELLIAKNVLTFTELPEMVREKILSRKDARDRLASSNDIMFTDEGIL